jgi:RNA polymerase sigma factor (sigma-70 family)
MEETGLIENIRKGDQDAFRLLVDTYQHKVYNTVVGFVHGSEDAQDLTQDVFVELYQSLPAFRGNCSLSTWIYRISVNKALNHLRKKKHTPFSFLFHKSNDEESKSSLPDPVDTTLNPAANLENQELKQELQRAIDSLPDKQRTAFILDKLEDLPYKEIAEVMQTSISAVESLLHRAKLNLQKQLLRNR